MLYRSASTSRTHEQVVHDVFPCIHDISSSAYARPLLTTHKKDGVDVR